MGKDINMGVTIDISGKKYGKLLVLKQAKHDYIGKTNRGIVWECRCDCGNIVNKNGASLKRGQVRSCGKCTIPIKIGDRVGRLEVIAESPTRVYGKRLWEVRCDCGKTLTVNTSNLTQFQKTHCGCQLNNYMGKRFGKLTVVEKIDLTKDGRTIWKCKCDCGKTIDLTGNSLSQRKKESLHCGCNSDIKGFKNIKSWLWRIMIRNAMVRNYEVTITPEDAYNKLVEQKNMCALSGEPISISEKYRAYDEKGDVFFPTTASLDRVDNAKGYLKDNIQWVHKDVNMLKKGFSDEAFLLWCEKICRHNNKGQLHE